MVTTEVAPKNGGAGVRAYFDVNTFGQQVIPPEMEFWQAEAGGLAEAILTGRADPGTSAAYARRARRAGMIAMLVLLGASILLGIAGQAVVGIFNRWVPGADEPLFGDSGKSPVVWAVVIAVVAGYVAYSIWQRRKREMGGGDMAARAEGDPMKTDRRTFMRQIGVILAGILLAGCVLVPPPAPQTEPGRSAISARAGAQVSCEPPSADVEIVHAAWAHVHERYPAQPWPDEIYLVGDRDVPPPCTDQPAHIVLCSHATGFVWEGELAWSQACACCRVRVEGIRELFVALPGSDATPAVGP